MSCCSRMSRSFPTTAWNCQARTTCGPGRLSRPRTMPSSGNDGWGVDDVIERVALERLAARCADEPGQLGRRHSLGRRRPGHVINLLFLYGAVEVVDAKPERGLRHVNPGRNPEGLDVRDVVAHQPRHGVNAKRIRR